MKKLRQALAMALTGVLLCAALCVPAGAAEVQPLAAAAAPEVDAPYALYIGNITGSIGKQPDGYLYFDASFYGYGNCSYTITITVEKKVDGKYQDIADRSTTVSGMGTHTFTFPDYNTFGGTYMGRITVEARNASGTLLERKVGYSGPFTA